jgi:tryptophanyl-tRNA synthetase
MKLKTNIMNDKYPIELKFPPRVLSGVQPTLDVHLGHYFGAIRQHIDMHHEYPGQSFFLIADYHSLTKGIDKKGDINFQNGIIELATLYIALGLDPSKAFLYRQSDIKEIFELAWIFNCITSFGWVNKAPTFKDQTNDEKRNTGLLTYPVLMAADILSIKGNLIPVGKDQLPYIEIVRDIAKRINTIVGFDFFPMPSPISSSNSIVNGIDGKKMSLNYNNHIKLFIPFNSLKQRVNSIITDSKTKEDSKDFETCNVYHLYQLVAPKDKVEKMKTSYINGGTSYSEIKGDLTHELQEYFSEFEDRYHKLKKEPEYIMDILREGFLTVRKEARNTLLELRELIGINK